MLYKKSLSNVTYQFTCGNSPFARESTNLLSYNNLSHAFNYASVWWARPTKKWRPQKSIHFNKNTLNVFTECLHSLYRNFFQQHLPKQMHNIYVYLTLYFFIDEMILLEIVLSVSCKDSSICGNISSRRSLYYTDR